MDDPTAAANEAVVDGYCAIKIGRGAKIHAADRQPNGAAGFPICGSSINYVRSGVVVVDDDVACVNCERCRASVEFPSSLSYADRINSTKENLR